LVGRRGPAQAAFSPKEIEEIAALPQVDVVVRPQEAALDDYSRTWLESQPRSAQRNVKFLTERAQQGEGTAPRKLRCRFLVAPVEFEGASGRVTAVRVQRAELRPDSNGTPRPQPIDDYETLAVDLVFKSIGYRGVPLTGLAFDERRGIVANAEGRVLDAPGGNPRRGHYVVGWAKRGPTGLIGTNSPDSKATVDKIIEDLQQDRWLAPAAEDAAVLLQRRGVDFVSWQDWQRLDAWEQQQGMARRKVRHKEPSVEALMAAVKKLRG
jgi:ferredoxin/flavodoxin---NADP+ reductase